MSYSCRLVIFDAIFFSRLSIALRRFWFNFILEYIFWTNAGCDKLLVSGDIDDNGGKDGIEVGRLTEA